MKQDSYPRFLKSEIYKECVKSEIEHRPLPYDDNVNGHAGSVGKDDLKKRKDDRKVRKNH